MHLRSLLAVILLAASASSARAQNLNVDVGAPGTSPTSNYAAGANQPGFWNNATSLTFTPQPLQDLNLATVAATLTLVAGGQFDGTFDNAGTTGDDQALMDDYQDGGVNPIWRFDNLTSGNYVVYTYAWAPDGATFIDQVSVTGSIDPPQNCGGNWPGAQTLGTTYTRHRVTVPAGGSITISTTIVQTYTTLNGFQIVLEDTPSTPFCDGSGVGTSCLACGNNGAPNNGCANSSFAAGGHLASSGMAGASAGTDTLKLTATNVTGPGLFFQATGLSGSPIAFGDGELCASQGIIRLGVVFPGSPSPANTAVYPGGLTPNPIHIGGGPLVAGDVRHYQCWYRDAIAFCTGATFNLTNGVTLTWGP